MPHAGCDGARPGSRLAGGSVAGGWEGCTRMSALTAYLNFHLFAMAELGAKHDATQIRAYVDVGRCIHGRSRRPRRGPEDRVAPHGP